MKVLLVDDDRQLVHVLAYALRREGCTVVTATDGIEALRRWEAERPDAVVLDVTLPVLDGFEVCRRIRQWAATPILLLTGRDGEADVLWGLQQGADAYVPKPCSARQLAARLRAVLRRCGQEPGLPPAREVRAGDLALDLESRRATRAGAPVHLTPLEFRLLALLAQHAGQVVPHSRLVQHAWGYGGEGAARRLKWYMSHLRRKLQWPAAGADGQGGISAVAGVGYRLIPAG